MAVYLAAFIVGGVSVLAALLLTDIGHGDGMPFLSLTGLSVALVGGGTGGLVATWLGLGPYVAGAVALAGAAMLVQLLHGVLMPYLRRQESNSHHGRSSYIGLLGTVTLEVPAGGWGEVSFVDSDGNRVFSRAKSAEPTALPKSTTIYIAEIDADFVHVVAVPQT